MDYIFYGIVSETTGQEINEMGSLVSNWKNASGAEAAFYYYKPIITIY